jgi:DNA repair exonuclease SbcCD nuclease subunit
VKFIHTSDIHLGAEPEMGTPWAEARQNEIWNTLQRMLDVCNEEEIDLFLIAGNLFHKQPLQKELKRLNEMLAGLKKTKVVFIAGDHDYLSARSRYRNFKWCDRVIMLDKRDLEEKYLYGLDTTVYGFSYMENEIYAPLYRDVKPKKSSGIHILLAHGGDQSHIPIDYAKLSDSGFDYIALGHSHKPRKFDNHMYYPGIPEPIDKDEVGKHGFIKGEFIWDVGEYKLETEFVPFSQRMYIDIHVRVSTDDTNASVIRKITSEMLKNGAGNLYRIYIEGIRNSAIEFDKEAIAVKGMITEVIDETVLDYNYEELRDENDDNIIGEFIEHIRSLDGDEALKDRALYYGIDALLKAKE